MEKNAACQVTLGQVETGELIKISGTIRHYSCERGEASFVLTRKDKARMGMVSVALAVAGMGGQAIATASNAATLQEEADYVEFDLGGKKVKGWLWRSPFKEGDVVDAAVVWKGEYFELVALANPGDRTIALYPHCVRGRRAFYTLVFRWWFIFAGLITPVSTSFFICLTGSYRYFFELPFWGGWAVIALGWTFVIFMLMLQWTPFGKAAQRVFSVLGLRDPSGVDLKKTTKAQRKPGDPPEMGAFFFRY
ncbi:putative type VI secretion system effector [Herbaspirillum huttiense]|uniref:Type VI secretion system effector n=2 Tax=Herbaspirillum huttiense TaxID=863372 RepID=A0AAJ2HA73_9BURK|nr:putative type VI secretion system effector [Herbaspirillum huttiense]MDR9836380.1 putative type VI secretion system effector [Herbaspirillum huttiense]MDR9836382.1 putative type VI secretion system effector [Herbaspirillum huttiense]